MRKVRRSLTKHSAKARGGQPNARAKFETLDKVNAEDRTRIKGLKLARPVPGRTGWLNIAPRFRLLRQLRVPLPFPEREAGAMDKLTAHLERGTDRQSLASSVDMRGLRKPFVDALEAAFAGYTDDQLSTVTVINQRWVVTSAGLAAVTAKQIKSRFRTDLNRVGVLKLNGPFVAILHGEFDPVSGLYVLHFHILTTREKATALRGLKALSGYRQTHSGAAPIVRERVRDRFAQFSYLIKSYWPARAVVRKNGRLVRERDHHRIPEPFASHVLVWLDRQRLLDTILMHDCWSKRNGGSAAMKSFYLIASRWR